MKGPSCCVAFVKRRAVINGRDAIITCVLLLYIGHGPISNKIQDSRFKIYFPHNSLYTKKIFTSYIWKQWGKTK